MKKIYEQAIYLEHFKQFIGYKVVDVIENEESNDSEGSISMLLEDKEGNTKEIFYADELLYVPSLNDKEALSDIVNPVECVIDILMRRTDISEADKHEIAMKLRSEA